jgi:hypothetical protein
MTEPRVDDGQAKDESDGSDSVDSAKTADEIADRLLGKRPGREEMQERVEQADEDADELATHVRSSYEVDRRPNG